MCLFLFLLRTTKLHNLLTVLLVIGLSSVTKSDEISEVRLTAADDDLIASLSTASQAVTKIPTPEGCLLKHQCCRILKKDPRCNKGVRNCKVESRVVAVNQSVTMCKKEYEKTCKSPCFDCPKFCKPNKEFWCQDNIEVVPTEKSNWHCVNETDGRCAIHKRTVETITKSRSCFEKDGKPLCAPINCHFQAVSNECRDAIKKTKVTLRDTICEKCSSHDDDEETCADSNVQNYSKSCHRDPHGTSKWIKECPKKVAIRGQEHLRLLQREDVVDPLRRAFDATSQPVQELFGQQQQQQPSTKIADINQNVASSPTEPTSQAKITTLNKTETQLIVKIDTKSPNKPTITINENIFIVTGQEEADINDNGGEGVDESFRRLQRLNERVTQKPNSVYFDPTHNIAEPEDRTKSTSSTSPTTSNGSGVADPSLSDSRIIGAFSNESRRASNDSRDASDDSRGVTSLWSWKLNNVDANNDPSSTPESFPEPTTTKRSPVREPNTHTGTTQRQPIETAGETETSNSDLYASSSTTTTTITTITTTKIPTTTTTTATTTTTTTTTTATTITRDPKETLTEQTLHEDLESLLFGPTSTEAPATTLETLPSTSSSVPGDERTSHQRTPEINQDTNLNQPRSGFDDFDDDNFTLQLTTEANRIANSETNIMDHDISAMDLARLCLFKQICDSKQARRQMALRTIDATTTAPTVTKTTIATPLSTTSSDKNLVGGSDRRRPKKVDGFLLAQIQLCIKSPGQCKTIVSPPPPSSLTDTKGKRTSNPRPKSVPVTTTTTLSPLEMAKRCVLKGDCPEHEPSNGFPEAAAPATDRILSPTAAKDVALRVRLCLFAKVC